MYVKHVLILGQTGSGKSTFARQLLRVTPRAIVIDSKGVDYTDGGIWDGYRGELVDTFRDAANFLRRNLAEDYHLIFRAPSAQANLGLLKLVYYSQKRWDLPPVALFIEESGLYSTSHDIPKILEAIVTRGRQHKINSITIAQRDTQVNPIIRAQSMLTVSLYQKKFSSDFRTEMTKQELAAIQSLKTLTPGTRPVYGTHYVTDPPGLDPIRELRRAATFAGY